jgi:phosphatidylglycerol lysyltransferase
MELHARQVGRRLRWLRSRMIWRGLAGLLFILALVYLAEALFSEPWLLESVFEQVVAQDSRQWALVGVLILSAILLFLTRGLARGKRQAWLLSTALLALTLLGALIERASWRSIILLLALLALALATAPLFSTRSDLRASIRGYTALVLGGWLTWGQSTLLHLWRAGYAHTSVIPLRFVLLSLRMTVYALLAYGVWQLVRPALGARASARELRTLRAEAVALVRSHGQCSTAHFALGVDKSYFWSQSRRSLIAYRAVGGVALALSDPIGPPAEHDEILDAFVAYCHRQDWRVALYQIGPETQRRCRQRGLVTVKIGEDALLDLKSFTLQGKPGAAVRHSVARAKRGGVSIHLYCGTPPPEETLSAMRAVSTAWLRDRDAKHQFAFSMGRFPADWSPDLLTAVAIGPTGALEGFATWTPLYAGNGWALDNMRRRADTTPGAMELLLAESIVWAKARGCERMTLGLVPLAGMGIPAGEEAGRNAGYAPLLLARGVEQGANYLHRRGLLLGAYRSLYSFKDKFQPAWEPRFLAVSEISALPQALSALSQAMGVGWTTMARDAWTGFRSRSTGGCARHS